MRLNLQPQTTRGLPRWNGLAIIIHLLWAWQFIDACILSFLIFMYALISGGWFPDHTWAQFLFLPSLLLILTIIIEICLYANGQLSPNIYLAVQVAKTIYIVIPIVKFSTASDRPYFFVGREGITWDTIWRLAWLWPPWIWAIGFAVFLKTEEVRNKGEEEREVEDEEAALLNSEESWGDLMPAQFIP